MDLFIFIYDSFLVYKPNFFFLMVFLFSILIIFFLINIFTFLFLKTEIEVVKIGIKKSIKDIKKIKNVRIPIPRSKFSLISPAKNVFVVIDSIFTSLRLGIEKVLKKIQNEIFIDE